MLDVCGTANCIDPNCSTPVESAQAYFGRRGFLKDLAGLGLAVGTPSVALMGCASPGPAPEPADTLIIGGRITTLNPKQPEVSALAVRGEKIIALGSDAEVMRYRGSNTKVIDAGRRRVIPGLIDAHTHFIRGGLTYTNEVRWDGVGSLADGLRMLRFQAARTPSPHWIQVIGGWTWAQFAERRFPTLDEINAATGDVPTMIMHMYDRLWLNKAAMRVLGWNRTTPNPFGCVIDRDGRGDPTGLLSGILPGLVATWLSVPRLPAEDQTLSTLHFMRENNRLGLTSVLDAGGGGQNYPENYAAVAELAKNKQLTLRIGYQLFAQSGGKELENYQNWSKMVSIGQGDDYYRMIGAGEYIVWALGDVSNFAKDSQPIVPAVLETQLTAVGKYLAGMNWPFRMHASFDNTAARALDVLEKVHREVPIDKLRWGFDHCETLSPQTLERIAKLGGSVNIQNRMSLDGEAFVQRYGAQVSADAPPIRRMMEMGLPLAAGTDGNRATSYNPWVGVHWLITGKTLGGAKLQGDRNLLDRSTALRMYSERGAWMSREEHLKGTLEVGKLADLVFLSDDYFAVPVDEIRNLESVMTMVGGRVAYGAGSYEKLALPAPRINQDWLPFKEYGRYAKSAGLPPQTPYAGHAHPLIISDAGNWRTACPCTA